MTTAQDGSAQVREVRDVFADIVADSRAGAAFMMVRRGEPVVGLWGGLADPPPGDRGRRTRSV